MPREHIGYLFWARRSDATTRRYVSRLFADARRSLPDDRLLLFQDDAFQLNPEMTCSDAIRFHRMASDYRRSRDVKWLSEMVHLYRGPFVSGFELPKSPEYEAWVQVARRLWARDYLAVLHLLVEDAVGSFDDDLAIDSARQYLQNDPLHEDMHRCLIELYGRRGDLSAAAEQYAICTELLCRKRGRLPSESTTTALESAQRGTLRNADIVAPTGHKRSFVENRQRRRLWQEPKVRRQKLVLS
mgnify:CR=1 FL=1